MCSGYPQSGAQQMWASLRNKKFRQKIAALKHRSAFPCRSCGTLRSFDLALPLNKIRPRLKSANCPCNTSICASPTANFNSTPFAVKFSSTTNPAKIRHAQLHQRQLGKPASTTQRHPADQLNLGRRLQTLVRATAIRPGQPASPQLNAAIPTNHQHRDLIAILRFNRRQNRSPSRATRFAIVIAAVLIAEFPCPAIVRGVQIAVLFKNACASAGLPIGAAKVIKRLLRISSRYSQKPLRVKGINVL
jgi:hypothetical protein